MNMHSDLIISQTDGRPMYLQIIEQIRQKVALGDWAAGTEIPSIRQLAASLCVSVITVKRAYLELERDGVIVTQQGRGSVISTLPTMRNTLLEDELDQHLDQAARLARLLGIAPAELEQRLRTANDQQQEP